MKLIVEAGSTKTDSILIAKNGVSHDLNKSQGINPVTDSNYHRAIQELAQYYKDQSIESIHYYGSGCINDHVCQNVAKVLSSELHVTDGIEVKDDLIAVGRGLCKHKAGIVAILGTGSNIGYYDGNEITDGIKSCGYLLGDEGSGFNIGQAIYRRYARNNLSIEEVQLISSAFQLDQENCITSLYKTENPRKHLASYAVIFEKLESSTQTEITNEVFDPFIQRLIYPMFNKFEVPVYISGSIAHHFTEALQQKFQESNILASSFVKSPLAGLIEYHTYE